MSGVGDGVAPQIIRANELTREVVRRNPALSKIQLFSNFAAGYLVGASVALHPCGEECGVHDHRGAVEVFFVMHGTGIIEVNGEPYNVEVGDCVIVPPGVLHNLRGTSEENFTVFCAFVVAPGHEADTTPWVSTDAS